MSSVLAKASLAVGLTVGPTVVATAKSKAPIVTSISGLSAEQDQTITITGSNFGSQPPYNGDSNYISLNICPTAKFKYSCKGGWQAGYAPDGNVTGLIVQSWTDTQIVIGGFTGYDCCGYTLMDGGTVRFEIYNVPTLKHGKASLCTVTIGAGQTSC